MDRQKTNHKARLNLETPDFIMESPDLPAAAVDLFQLINERSDQAVSFLEELLKRKLSMELSADFKTSKWAFEQSVEMQNRSRLYGGHWFWFGFPLLRVNTDNKVYLAPLWLWPLQLKSPAGPEEGWVLQNATQPFPQPNPQLDLFFRKNLDWEEAQPWWHPVPNPSIKRAGLSTLVNHLADKIELEIDSKTVSINPWPGSDSMNSETPARQLLWSGLIGPFPPGYPQMVTEDNKVKLPEKTGKHPFGLLIRDPWQETAFLMARTNRGSVIHGSGGSGKSALLKDLLINALSNGERCLVLSDRMESLRELQQELIESDLDEFVLLFHQVEEEAGLALQLLKAAAKNKKKSTFTGHTFQQELTDLLGRKESLDRAYRAANKKVLGSFTWTQVVGMYLAAARLESKALLASQLNPQDFDLGYERYQLLCEKLAHSQVLFEEIKTLNHPLAILNAGIFVHQEKEEAKAFIFSKIREFSELGTSLQHQFILEQSDYGDRLVDRYELFYRELSEQTVKLREKVNTYRKRFGRDPLESTRTTLKLYASFSEKFRQTLAAKDDLAADYLALEKKLKQEPYFHHDFLPFGERHLLGKLLTNLESLLEQLKQWREQLGNSLQDELIRLSSKTVHADIPRHQMIGDLENQLELLVEGLNDSGLLQLPLENKNLTLPKRQRFLEEVLEKLDRLRYNMRDFDRFYEWQRYWFGLPAEARRIITALVKVKPADWSAAFSSWYLHHKLLQSADPHLPDSLVSMEEFVHKLRSWRQRLIAQITDHWTDQRKAVLQGLKKEKKILYDFLSAKKESGKEMDLTAFTGILSHFFPIILASARTAYPFLAPKGGYDYIVVDEAHNLPVELLEIWRNRSRKMVLFNNPNFANREIGAWARKQAWPQFTLKGRYLPPVEVQVEAVDGRYNARQGINDEEARKVISLLKTIEENPQRTLPKVGIVAFTRSQRNLIVQYLHRIKKQRLAGFEKVQQLDRNGLGVYTPDELYGLHADMLLISATFGRTGAGDQLTPAIQLLDQQYQPGIVPLIRTRSRQTQIILHSIPEEDLARLAREKTNVGNTAALARWLLAARQSENGGGGEVPADTPVHPMAAEIAWHIADQIRTDRLAFSLPFRQAMVPMTIAPLKGKTFRAIVLNGFFSETKATCYQWEFLRHKDMEEEGFEVHPIWAVNWWKRPEREAAALLEMLNATVEEEE